MYKQISKYLLNAISLQFSLGSVFYLHLYSAIPLNIEIRTSHFMNHFNLLLLFTHCVENC